MVGFLPPGKQTFVDENGVPLAGGFVHHYIPGGSVRKDTWQDYDQTSLNTNPIVLDARGQCMIFGSGKYRQRLTDSAGNEIWDRNTLVGDNTVTLSAGQIYGLTIANDVSNPTTQIDISAGQCRDSTNTVDIVLPTGITKDITAVWAVGNLQGMRDSATALAASQSYAIFVIYNDEDDIVDVLCSQSATNPTLPSGYTYFRRIAFLPRLGSDNIPPSGTNIPTFYQWGNQFLLYDGNNEYSGQTGSTAQQLKDMLLPLGDKVDGIFYAQVNLSPAATVNFRVWDPDQGLIPVLGGSGQWAQIRLSTNETYLVQRFSMSCNTSGQVYVEVSNASATWALKTLGWVDYRGLYG